MGDEPVDLETRWQRSPLALWRRTTDGVVLLPPTSSTPIGLRGSGALLWDIFDEPSSLLEAAELLHEVVGVGVDDLLEDIAPAVRELVTGGVLVPVA